MANYYLAHQGAISLTENAALVHEDILGDGASLCWSNETVALPVGEPFDASLHLFRHLHKDMISRVSLPRFPHRTLRLLVQALTDKPHEPFSDEK